MEQMDKQDKNIRKLKKQLKGYMKKAEEADREFNLTCGKRANLCISS